MSSRCARFLPLALLLAAGLAACGSDDKKQIINYNPPPEAPLDGKLTLNVADSAMQGDQPQLALDVTNAILAKDPNDAQAWQRQGDAYFALGEVPKAETSYRKALTALANRPGTGPLGISGLPLAGPSAASQEVIQRVKMGLGRIELGRDAAKAEARFADVVATDPANTIALNNLGIARDMRGRHAEAQEAYRKLLQYAPNDVGAQVNLGLSLALSGNSEQAIEVLKPLAQRPDSTPRMRQDYALALAMGGHMADAEKVLATDMPPEQAAAAVRSFRELPNTTAAPIKIN